MKTQMASGSCGAVFFPMSPATAVKPGRFNGGSPDFPRVSLQPVAVKRISGGGPARPNHSGLPASLADWLVCKEALEICRCRQDGTEDGSDAWVMTARPATR